MEFIHNIWFCRIMTVVLGYVILYSIYAHRNSYKYEHLATSSSYWGSLMITIIICVAILIAWRWRGLPTMTWEIVQRFELKLRNVFPTLVAIVTTIIGMFVTFALLRPHLKIANTVAFIRDSNKLVFNVKNNGFFKVQNLTPVLYLCTFQRNKVIVPIKLDLLNLSSLDWRFAHSDLCCWDIATQSEEGSSINKMLYEMSDEQCLELRVSATHIISGKSITEIKTFYKNDILVGKFSGDTLYSCDNNGVIIKKLYTEKDTLRTINKFIQLVEFIIAILLIADLGWIAGGQFAKYLDYYVLVAKVMSLCLFTLELARCMTNLPVDTSYNDLWSYDKYIKPLPEREPKAKHYKRKLFANLRNWMSSFIKMIEHIINLKF